MDTTTKLIAAAERLFDRHGYMATGMDRLTEAAGMSSRTLYKHAGSKAELMARVLGERDRRFLARIEVQSVDALFAALEDWAGVEGMRGCLFLRARAETGGDVQEITGAVAEHKAAFRARLSEIVVADLGHDDPALTEQVLVLFEGATHAAVYRGPQAISAARAAAATLVEGAREVSPALRVGAVGFGLIAVCYGFARFAFGLFLPQIDGDLGLGPSLSGAISGGSFAGYCIAIVASAVLTERIGARAVAVAAALVAALGMAGIALAPSPLILAAAVMVAGSSTGLASPPMAAAVAASVARDRQDATNTTINAGTSAGVALSGPIALAMTGQWRLAFGAFAVLAVGLAIAIAASLPASRGGKGPGGLPVVTGPVLRLIAAAFLMGAASTALWSFGSQLVSQRLGWGPAGTGILWSCIGAGGIIGAAAGSLVNRFGLDRVHRAFLGLMAAGILAVGSGIAAPPLALAGGALFGAAYVMLTGVYLIWGVRALPDRPATGLMIGFLTIAVGQTAGAPVFGLLMASPGAGPAVAAFAVLALVAGLFRARRTVATTVAWSPRGASSERPHRRGRTRH